MIIADVAQPARSNEIAVISHNAKSMPPSEHEMMVFHTMAEQAITSKMYAGTHKDQSSIMMIMLAARELGIPPMQALNRGINIINGSVEISARMMNALIRKSGHQIKVVESTELNCVLQGKRRDTGETLTTSFSMAEAQKAGLVKAGGGWQKWPKDMCFARALSRLARQLFSDVIGMGYVEGEISGQDVKHEIQAEVQEHFVEQEITLQDDPGFMDKYLDLFDKADRFHAVEYLNAVMNHFTWTQWQAVTELLKDQKRLFDKFNVWKDKIKKVDDV